jgi:hypothetical protein
MTEHEYEVMRERLEQLGVPQAPRKAAKSSSATMSRPEDKSSLVDILVQRRGPSRCRFKNKTEEEFERILKAQYPNSQAILWECFKFRIGERCWYLPDFIRIGMAGNLTIYEVKGPHIWDDALVKFKAAKEKYPFITWEMHQKRKDGWRRVL